jgi:hypothetical protein
LQSAEVEVLADEDEDDDEKTKPEVAFVKQLPPDLCRR